MSHSHKVILDLCGGTGAWSRPYAESGYDVRVVTLPDQDVRLYKHLGRVHGILAATPCTHFSRVGAQFWKEKGSAALLEGLAVADACCRIILMTNPVWWAIENPIGRLSNYLGPPHFKFDPYEFGDPWTKRTWLWGRFVPPVPIISEQARKGLPRAMAANAPGWKGDVATALSRSALRSKTPNGFARAFFEANP